MEGESGKSEQEPEYDKEKYVSYAEYLRDVNALNNKWIKIIFFVVLGFAISYANMYFIEYLMEDGENYIVVANFDIDVILAYLAILVLLMIIGVWVGVAKHKIYAVVYFSGFAAAGLVYTILNITNLSRASVGLYDFVVSFFLLIIVYLVFFKIWAAVKKSVAKPKL